MRIKFFTIVSLFFSLEFLSFFSNVCISESNVFFRRVREIEPQRLLSRARETTNIEEKLSLLREVLDKYPRSEMAKFALWDLVYILDLLGEYLPAAQTLGTFRSGGEEGGRPVIEAPYQEIYYLARLFYKLGRSDKIFYDKAIETFRLLIETVQDPEFQTLCQEWIGLTYLAQGRYLDAYNTFNRIKSTEHKFITAYLRALDLLIKEIGKKGKPIVGIGDMKGFAQNQKTPIYFFAAVPKGSRVRVQAEGFEKAVEILNENFQYLSGGKFGLDFKGVKTIEVDFRVKDQIEQFLEPVVPLEKEVFNLYWHSLEEIYALAGTGFIFIIDPRLLHEVGWRYEENGVISISGRGISLSMVPRLIHEILHGFDAIHYDLNIEVLMNSIEHKFEQEPDIMMSTGELPYLALSEFNRRRVGWSKVEPRRLFLYKRP